MVLIIGETLSFVYSYKDKSYVKLGSTPFHIAFHLLSLGVPACFISRVGDDENGRRILNMLEKSNIGTDMIQVDEERPTGRVHLREEERKNTDLSELNGSADGFISYDHRVNSKLKKNVDLVYINTLIQRSLVGYNTVKNILKNKSDDTLCLCDINHNNIFSSDHIIRNSLEHSDIIRIDLKNLKNLKELFKSARNDREFIVSLMNEYSIKWLLLRKAEDVSELYTSGVSQPIEAEQENEDAPVIADTFGASDSFLSVIALGYLQGWTPQYAVNRADEFAAEICKIKGAIPYSNEFYDRFRANWDIGG